MNPHSKVYHVQLERIRVSKTPYRADTLSTWQWPDQCDRELATVVDDRSDWTPWQYPWMVKAIYIYIKWSYIYIYISGFEVSPEFGTFQKQEKKYINQPNLGTSRTPQMTSISPPFATFQWSLAPCSACALSQRQLLWGTQPAGVRYIKLSHESIYTYIYIWHGFPIRNHICISCVTIYIYTQKPFGYIYIYKLTDCCWLLKHVFGRTRTRTLR